MPADWFEQHEGCGRQSVGQRLIALYLNKSKIGNGRRGAGSRINCRSMSKTDKEQMYELVMRDATDNVLLVAVRQAIDTRLLNVVFDAGRGPGPHPQHVLTIQVRDDPSIAVVAEGINHEWLPIATGFIDTRFSRIVGGLLAELVKKAQEAGRFI